MGWARRLWPVATFQFCFVAALALLKPAANALVLSHLSSAALPGLYLSAAGITGALAAWNATEGRRWSVVVLALLGAVSTGLLALGIWLDLAAAYVGAYLFAESFATSVALAFWAAMADAFDAREARRAFTSVNAVGMSGAIAGGLFAQALADSSHTLYMLFGAAVLFALAALAFGFHQSVLETQRRPTRGFTWAVWGTLIKGRYERSLGALVLGLSLLSVLADFVFRARAAQALNEAQMASSFAALQTWTGVFCAAFQLFAAQWILRRLGILKYLTLVPMAFALLALSCALFDALWLGWALKLVEGAAALSLLPVGFQLLYAPLPDERRDNVRSAIDGFLRKGGLLLGGLVLLVGAQLSVKGVAVGVVVLSVAVIVWLWRMRPKYVEALHARVAGAQTSLDLEERVLAEALKSDSAERVLRALALLEMAEVSLTPYVRQLVTHPHERVQERGVQLALSLKVPNVAAQLEALLSNGSRRPRDLSALALAQLAPERAVHVLPPLLESADVGLRCAAIGALLSVPNLPSEVMVKAQSALEVMLTKTANAKVVERREMARLLGRVRDERWSSHLLPYLDDADPTVRRLAIAAVGQGGYLALAPKLLRFLSWREDRRVAREALSSLGESAVSFVATALDDKGRSLSLRYQLPRVLRQIGTQAAFDALLFSNASDDPFLHYRVGVALSRLRQDRPSLRVDRRRVLEALERRRQTFLKLGPAWRDVKAGLGTRSLLTRALEGRLDQAFELSFWLLGLLHDARSLKRAHAQLLGADARRKAYALELLDNLLDDEERGAIDAQLEALQRPRPGDPQRVNPHLIALSQSDDLIVRLCAREVARKRGAAASALAENEMSDETIRRLFSLEGVEIFAQCDVDDLAAVAQVAREEPFKSGEKVYVEGDPGDAVYVIVEGSADILRDGQKILSLGPRQAFGELSIFDGAPRVTEVVATKDLKTLAIDRRDLLDVLADRPELLRGIFLVLSEQLKTMVIDLAQRRTTGDAMPAVGS